MSNPQPAPPDVAATAARVRRQLHWMVLGALLLNVLLFLIAGHFQRKERAAQPPPTGTTQAVPAPADDAPAPRNNGP